MEWGEAEYSRDRRAVECRWMVAMAVAVGGGGGLHHDLTLLYMFRSHSWRLSRGLQREDREGLAFRCAAFRVATLTSSSTPKVQS